MTTKGPEQPTLLIDDPLSIEVYADRTSGFALMHETVAITFESARWDHSKPGAPASRVVVARVRMSLVGAQNLAAGLYDFLAQRGHDPAGKPSEKTVQ